MRLPCNTIAPETAEHFDQRFTADCGQLAHGLHFSVAILALAGIRDLLSHPSMIRAQPAGRMKNILRKNTASQPYSQSG